MAFIQTAISVFEKIKGEGRLWWFKQNDEYPKMIMIDVVIALLPACVFGCILFGMKAFLVLLISSISAIASEFLWNLILKKEQTAKDLSALVTGLLFGMCLPNTVPIWLVILGSVFAVIGVKLFFGGLGYNLTNPAITSFLLLSLVFPKYMTNFQAPFYGAERAISTLSFADLFFGLRSGSIGETSCFLLLIGGFYLIIRKIISPIVPLIFIGTNALFCLIFSQNLLISVFGSSLFLGAIFMANDYTTSPTSNSGKIIYGFGCGILTFLTHIIFKNFDGVFLAIFIMNILFAIYVRLGFRKYKDLAINESIAFFKKWTPLSIAFCKRWLIICWQFLKKTFFSAIELTKKVIKILKEKIIALKNKK